MEIGEELNEQVLTMKRDEKVNEMEVEGKGVRVRRRRGGVGGKREEHQLKKSKKKWPEKLISVYNSNASIMY